MSPFPCALYPPVQGHSTSRVTGLRIGSICQRETLREEGHTEPFQGQGLRDLLVAHRASPLGSPTLLNRAALSTKPPTCEACGGTDQSAAGLPLFPAAPSSSSCPAWWCELCWEGLTLDHRPTGLPGSARFICRHLTSY